MGPPLKGFSDLLERVQKFTLRMCTRDWNADYATLLHSSNLPTLANRRHYLKLCFLYQVIQGQFNLPGAPVVRRNLPLKLKNNSTFLLLRPVTCSNAHQFSFFPHFIYLWNSLPLQYIVVTLCTPLNVLYCNLIMYNFFSFT